MLSTPKLLILYAHPEAHDSVANRVLLKSALKLKHVTVHDLYANYPDFFIDIDYEQQLLRKHKIIVFQHPLYTYSCPALLKEWLDRVLSRDFSNGINGHTLSGKYWRSVLTTGEAKKTYYITNNNYYSIEDILRPFELTAAMCHMNWLKPIIIYLARQQKPEILKNHAIFYNNWLCNPLSNKGF
ncbi:Glutathione-regulated potassium-efflux system ancillary protein KefG [Serratia symbiotica]|nr:Glutathione-regulated potassium-efflux system ancillary protein KefG [Serratia symbiotica]